MTSNERDKWCLQIWDTPRKEWLHEAQTQSHPPIRGTDGTNSRTSKRRITAAGERTHPVLRMYPHFRDNIPTIIPTRKAGFQETVLDVKRRNPQCLLGIYEFCRMSLDVLKLVNGGE